MLDKTIPYKNIIMRRQASVALPQVSLPPGFTFVGYCDGDAAAWAEIETSVLEFDSVPQASMYFAAEYLPYLAELKKRTLFVRSDEGSLVSTFTAWWQYTGVRRDPWVHWVAVRPEFQGKGIGKAVVFEGMRRLLEIEGDREVFLHTQTWSHRAIGIYLKAGFEFVLDGHSLGGQINESREALEVLKQAGIIF